MDKMRQTSSQPVTASIKSQPKTYEDHFMDKWNEMDKMEQDSWISLFKKNKLNNVPPLNKNNPENFKQWIRQNRTQLNSILTKYEQENPYNNRNSLQSSALQNNPFNNTNQQSSTTTFLSEANKSNKNDWNNQFVPWFLEVLRESEKASLRRFLQRNKLPMPAGSNHADVLIPWADKNKETLNVLLNKYHEDFYYQWIHHTFVPWWNSQSSAQKSKLQTYFQNRGYNISTNEIKLVEYLETLHDVGTLGKFVEVYSGIWLGPVSRNYFFIPKWMEEWVLGTYSIKTLQIHVKTLLSSSHKLKTFEDEINSYRGICRKRTNTALLKCEKEIKDSLQEVQITRQEVEEMIKKFQGIDLGAYIKQEQSFTSRDESHVREELLYEIQDLQNAVNAKILQCTQKIDSHMNELRQTGKAQKERASNALKSIQDKSRLFKKEIEDKLVEIDALIATTEGLKFEDVVGSLNSLIKYKNEILPFKILPWENEMTTLMIDLDNAASISELCDQYVTQLQELEVRKTQLFTHINSSIKNLQKVISNHREYQKKYNKIVNQRETLRGECAQQLIIMQKDITNYQDDMIQWKDDDNSTRLDQLVRKGQEFIIPMKLLSQKIAEIGLLDELSFLEYLNQPQLDLQERTSVEQAYRQAMKYWQEVRPYDARYKTALIALNELPVHYNKWKKNFGNMEFNKELNHEQFNNLEQEMTNIHYQMNQIRSDFRLWQQELIQEGENYSTSHQNEVQVYQESLRILEQKYVKIQNMIDGWMDTNKTVYEEWSQFIVDPHEVDDIRNQQKHIDLIQTKLQNIEDFQKFKNDITLRIRALPSPYYMSIVLKKMMIRSLAQRQKDLQTQVMIFEETKKTLEFHLDRLIQDRDEINKMLAQQTEPSYVSVWRSISGAKAADNVREKLKLVGAVEANSVDNNNDNLNDIDPILVLPNPDDIETESREKILKVGIAAVGLTPLLMWLYRRAKTYWREKKILARIKPKPITFVLQAYDIEAYSKTKSPKFEYVDEYIRQDKAQVILQLMTKAIRNPQPLKIKMWDSNHLLYATDVWVSEDMLISAQVQIMNYLIEMKWTNLELCKTALLDTMNSKNHSHVFIPIFTHPTDNLNPKETNQHMSMITKEDIREWKKQTGYEELNDLPQQKLDKNPNDTNDTNDTNDKTDRRSPSNSSKKGSVRKNSKSGKRESSKRRKSPIFTEPLFVSPPSRSDLPSLKTLSKKSTRLNSKQSRNTLK